MKAANLPPEVLGRAVVADGRLAQLQTRLQFSMAQMGELVGVAAGTYHRWIRNPGTDLHEASAERVGAIYQRAVDEIAWLREDGIRLDSLVSFHRAATRLGRPHELLLAKARQGTIPSIDMGVLGLWMTMDTYTALINDRRRHVASRR